MLDLSAVISYSRPTVFQKVPTTLIEADDPAYTSTVSPFTYTSTKYSVILTMSVANDPSKTFPSIISTEALQEDGAVDENNIQSQLPAAQLDKSSLSLSDGVLRYPSILPSTSKEAAELIHMPSVSNDYTLITLKASNALPPEKVQLRTGAAIVSTQSSVHKPTTSTHDYLLGSSPTRVVSDEVSRLPKAPENSLFQESTIIPGIIYIYHTDKISSSSRASDTVEYIQQAGKTSVLYDSSGTLAAYTSTSSSHEEIPNLASTQTSVTEVSTTSSTADAKSRSKGSQYIEKRTLGIVLGSVSGAGIVFCAILILYRQCYRRFRDTRKRNMWIAQNSENLNVRNTSFTGHCDHREISRFSVDS
jgi:hypothetical protein